MEGFLSIRASLADFLSHREETVLKLMEEIVDVIRSSRTCSKTKSCFVEILQDQIKILLESTDFQSNFLLSKNVYVQYNSVKLLTNFAANFDNEKYQLSSVLFDYEHFGCLSFDAFENLFRLSSDNIDYKKFLIAKWRIFCENFIVNNSKFVNFDRLFYVWHGTIVSDDKKSNVLFTEECFEFWPNLYASIFEIFFKQQNFEYCSLVESFKVIDRLLTVCLECAVYKENLHRRLNYANFCESCKLLLKNVDFKRILVENRRHWFGGILQEEYDADLNLERLIILLHIKSQIGFILNSDETDLSVDSLECVKQMDAYHVIQLFIHQDDHLCELLLSNVLLRENCTWNCHELMFIFLQSVDWSYEISLDFIVSPETLFLPYFVKYLKTCLSDMNGLLSTLDNFRVNGKVRDIIVEDCSDGVEKMEKSFSLKISELIGDVETTKNMQINPLPKCSRAKLSKNEPIEKKMLKLDTENLFLQYLRSLAEKLEKLHSKQLLRFNPNFLLKQLTGVISKLCNK